MSPAPRGVRHHQVAVPQGSTGIHNMLNTVMPVGITVKSVMFLLISYTVYIGTVYILILATLI